MKQNNARYNPESYITSLAIELVDTYGEYGRNGAIAVVGLGKRLRDHLAFRSKQCAVEETTKTMFTRLNEVLKKYEFEGSWRDAPKDWDTGGILYFVRPLGADTTVVSTNFPLFNVAYSETREVKLACPTSVINIVPFSNDITLEAVGEKRDSLIRACTVDSQLFCRDQ